FHFIQQAGMYSGILFLMAEIKQRTFFIRQILQPSSTAPDLRGADFIGLRSGLAGLQEEQPGTSEQ
ncbi:hypothetical protein, partial [Klebsiella pneumoniae]